MRCAALGFLALASPAQAADLSLVCSGSGTKRTVTHSFDNQAVAATSSNFNDQIRVEIGRGVGRIRIPPGMLPEIRSGGSDGWWALQDVSETRSEIAARVRFNMFNKPSIKIDRITGHILISNGSSSFSGQCEAFDASKPKF